ncbi:phage head-tail connector protein [Anaplasma platys]|uniref:Phage head-tail connector protein n=1 Tax=Anaplasma platys TaxID=949 RepID=A0A858PYC8_9RICK|nr:phage head-tail connector protein [Anaplasma platys]QJC27572.1 phage head-tail connector protein [Anaplasma platys]
MMENSVFEVIRRGPPADLPISLAEAKSFIGIKNEEEDVLVRRLVSISTEYAQWFMEKSLAKQAWQLSYSGKQMPLKIYLPFGPLLSVSEVNIQEKSRGITVHVARDKYRVDTALSCIVFITPINTLKVEVTYLSGYENTDSIPAQVKYGILYHTAVAYKNRSDMDVRHLAFIKDIYQPFKEVRIVL